MLTSLVNPCVPMLSTKYSSLRICRTSVCGSVLSSWAWFACTSFLYAPLADNADSWLCLATIPLAGDHPPGIFINCPFCHIEYLPLGMFFSCYTIVYSVSLRYLPGCILDYVCNDLIRILYPLMWPSHPSVIYKGLWFTPVPYHLLTLSFACLFI